jgi:hypothetical protein
LIVNVSRLLLGAFQPVPFPAITPDDTRLPAAGRWRRCLLAWVLALLALHPAAAQEALRASLAGESALEQQKKAVANPDYNLKMGDLKLRFQSSLAVEANDNVNLTQANRQADMSLRPELDVTALWPVSDRNTLALTLGGGYEKYLRTKKLDSLFLNPDSTLSFNIYAGDFLINLHTHFVYTEQQYQNVDVSSSGNYDYFDDLTGVTTTWDLDKLKLQLTYDHDVYLSGTSGFSYLNRSSELVSFRAGLELNPTTIVGLELGGSLANYDQKASYTNSSTVSETVITNYLVNGHVVIPLGYTTNLNFSQKQPAQNFLGDQKSVNFGPYLQTSLSKFMQVRASAGYTIYFLGQSSFAPYPGEIQSFTTNEVLKTFTTNRFAAASTTLNAIYADVTLTHVVNQKVQYNLSVGHQIQQGVYSDTLDLYYFTLNPTLAWIRNTTLSLPINYDYVQRSGSQAENYHDLQAGVTASYQFTRKLNVGASYFYRMKQSDVPLNDFIQNQLVLDLHYSL